jgi:hypothetical protein
MSFRARLLALVLVTSLIAGLTYGLVVPALCGVFPTMHHHR